MSQGEPVLQLQGVEKTFGALRIVRGAELTVRNGERHALIGPNGAGKSTLFNLISGQIAPSAGEIRLRGRRIDGLSPEKVNRLGLGRSFQLTSVFSRMTTFENLRVATLRRAGVRFSVVRPASCYAAANAHAEDLLDAVNLTRRRDIRAGELPYSEQRALEIALTLATDPEVILLDEPTSGMSREEATHAMELIQSVTRDRTLLIVEHDMDIVFKLCDHISVLVYGQVIASGTPDEIRSDPRVREAYLGSLVQ
jgi:branched-chain amino acid transport system ATP-binding protein